MPSEAARHFADLNDDIRAFRHFLTAERGMAVNTVLAYGRDLDRFALGGRRRPGPLPDTDDPRPDPLPRPPARRKTRSAERGPPSGGPEDVLPFSPSGRTNQPEHGRSAQLAGPVGTNTPRPQSGERGPTPGRPSAERPLFPPRSGPAGNVVRHGQPGLGSGQAPNGRSLPGVCFSEIHGKREQAARGAPGRTGHRSFACLSRRAKASTWSGP